MGTNKTSVVVYSKPLCSDCIAAEGVLSTAGVVFEHKDVKADPSTEAEFKLICTGLKIEPRLPVIVFSSETEDGHEGRMVFVEPQGPELEVLRFAAEHHQHL